MDEGFERWFAKEYPEDYHASLKFDCRKAYIAGRQAQQEALDGEKFYNLMQMYRHAPMTSQEDVCKAYEAVKAFIACTALRRGQP